MLTEEQKEIIRECVISCEELFSYIEAANSQITILCRDAAKNAKIHNGLVKKMAKIHFCQNLEAKKQELKELDDTYSDVMKG